MIELPQPFDLTSTLFGLRHSSFGAPYRFLAPDRVRRLIQLEGRPHLVEFALQPGALHVQLITAGNEQGVRSLARRIWSLDDDLTDCYAHLRQDPVLGPITTRYNGYRPVRTPSLFEAILVAVVGQLISVQAAHAIRHRLMVGLGDRIVVGGEEYLSFPTPTQLMAAPTEALLGFGLTKQKARCLQEVASRAAAGELANEAFDDLSNKEAIARLTVIPGVGRWTADVALLFGLGRSEIFLAGDVALAAAVQRAFGVSERPTERDLRLLAERWAPWQSYAVAYLMLAQKE